MDSIRVSKVEHVSCTKSGTTLLGTVHLTAHHLIFRYNDQTVEEMWVPYPLISLVTRLPQTLKGQSPLTFHSRTFETFTIFFDRDVDAGDVFESVKALTVTTSVNQLYAFFYRPEPPLTADNGWSIYSPRDEFMRMGMGTRSKAWRFTDLNKDYSFSPTYPARLVVPTKISDATLQYASKYRSKARIPALTYLHWGNFASITRASQPMVGITQNRSIQDEKLLEAIFHSHHAPSQRVSAAPIYGATTTNLIVDARPTANAVANTAKGAGTENMDNYKDAKKVYLGIDHIHTMRDSLGKVVEVLREADSGPTASNDLEPTPAFILDKQALRRSGWLRHMTALLEGTLIIVRNIHVNNSHVFIHCSDGWDRTSQLSALAQLCLDPYYRTIRGFQILVEKDWVSFGHKFLDRCGHLSSDKFFVTPPPETGNTAGGAEAAQAFLASVQNRFASQHHVKETSPTFHQFLESIRQLQRQFPKRFEFNERFLRRLHYHLYSCQFGTFLFNTERDRRCSEDGPPPCEQTVSVWDLFNSAPEMEQNRNPEYDPSLDDPTNRDIGADMGVLLPNPKDVRFWHELYGRTDEEMNGRAIVAPLVRDVEEVGPIEGATDDPVIRATTPASVHLPPSPSKPASPSLPHINSLSPAQPPSRSTSPSRGIGSKMLDLPSASSSREMVTPLGSSLTPFNHQRSVSPSLPSSASFRGTPTKPGDFFSSGGVKSMWGKLSSNATAAFSAVQEVYQEVRKDPKGPETSKAAELRGRNDLGSWNDDQRGRNNVTPPLEANPWASSTARRSPLPRDILSENPWNSVRVSGTGSGTPISDTDLFASPGLFPHDPTISRPTPRSASLVSSQSSKVAGAESVGQFTPSPSPSDSGSSAQPSVAVITSQSDPLGVGLL
ncbi:protein-tyrosine phosphatase family protein [Pleurotus pulmonarius]